MIRSLTACVGGSDRYRIETSAGPLTPRTCIRDSCSSFRIECIRLLCVQGPPERAQRHLESSATRAPFAWLQYVCVP
jgi:hypothetical protein